MPPRKLTPEAIASAAVDLADREGIEGLTMRSLARHLGVEAMSLYHHFVGKDALLDAMVDRVYGEIVLPAADGNWRAELRRRSASVREALRRHPWAVPLMESRRTPGPATLAYHDANIACLRAAGFSADQVAHAYAIVDAYVYGFTLSETALPFDTGEEAAVMVQEEPLQALLTAYPNMGWFVENVVLVPGYSFAREFAPGLELLLDGIESRRRGVPASGPSRGA